jgi:hypothetical protein
MSEDGAHCEAADTQRRTASAEGLLGEEAVSRRGIVLRERLGPAEDLASTHDDPMPHCRPAVSIRSVNRRFSGMACLPLLCCHGSGRPRGAWDGCPCRRIGMRYLVAKSLGPAMHDDSRYEATLRQGSANRGVAKAARCLWRWVLFARLEYFCCLDTPLPQQKSAHQKPV